MSDGLEPIANFNYIGKLLELCKKRKMTDHQIGQIFTELKHEYTCNRFIFNMSAAFQHDQRTFSGTGRALRKQDAKNLSAKNCLISFLYYLRKENHLFNLTEYGLTEQDFKNFQGDKNEKLNRQIEQVKSLSTPLNFAPTFEEMMNPKNYDPANNPFKLFSSAT